MSFIAKPIITLLAGVLLNSAVQAQPAAICDKCAAIRTFLNDEKVNRNGWYDKIVFDSLIIVDKKRVLEQCNIRSLRGLPVRLVSEGSTADSIKGLDAAHVFRTRCNWYLFEVVREKKGSYFFIGQGCSNVHSMAKFRKKRSCYYLEEVKNGVF